MNCKRCKEPIILVPSAAERADKLGGTAEFYESLFTHHNHCIMELRRESTARLLRTRKELA